MEPSEFNVNVMTVNRAPLVKSWVIRDHANVS